MRVGNDEYARTNASFGLTTMRNEHADVEGNTIHFQFRGKSGIEHDIDLCNLKLAATVRRCQELPGQELFAYLDDNAEPKKVSSSDVNEYIRAAAEATFTAKDFRTWAGTSRALLALARLGDFHTRSEGVRNVNRAIDEVAAELGNTRSVCRKSYIHPAIPQAYLDHALLPLWQSCSRHRQARQSEGLMSEEESATLALLKKLQTRSELSRPPRERRLQTPRRRHRPRPHTSSRPAPSGEIV